MRRLPGAVVPALALLPLISSCGPAQADPWGVEIVEEGLPSAPLDPRGEHSLLWSGEELLVWGGDGPGRGQHNSFADGAAYDPDTGTWRMLAESGLEPRTRHTAVMAGDRMLVWGGFTATYDETDAMTARDGALYDPESDTWEPIADAPEARDLARAAVVGDHVVFGGGRGADFLVYSLAEDAWHTVEVSQPMGEQQAYTVYDVAARGDGVVAVAAAGPLGRELVTLAFEPGEHDRAAVRPVPEAQENEGGTVSAGLATTSEGTALLTLRVGTTTRLYRIDGHGRAQPVETAVSPHFLPPVRLVTRGLLSGDMHAVEGLGLVAARPGAVSLWDHASERSGDWRQGSRVDYCGPLVPAGEGRLLGWGGLGCGDEGVSLTMDL
ncbi:kelch repeat-containing protein [Nocardiopsis sp. CNT312]|uniref:Kelch repeat-containing protein n=1 Tax=Nocardiopsis sp. CNT312 TaxID=1137268 RepID=UPI00048F9B4C|nr:kelch repeat-containing protein [Nocardiopsis sp. CNT312]